MLPVRFCWPSMLESTLIAKNFSTADEMALLDDKKYLNNTAKYREAR